MMNKLLLLTGISWMFCIAAFAQKDKQKNRPSSDSIEVVINFSGTHFYRHDKQLKPRQLKNLLQSNGQAYRHLNASKPPRVVAAVLSYAGGFMIGWPIGTAIAGGKPNWVLAGVGGGLVAVSIPLTISANRQLRKAINTYNAAL